MIKVNQGKVEVEGTKATIMAEYACTTESLVRLLGEKDVKFVFDMGCKRGKGEEILTPEIDGGLKNRMNAILKDAFKDDACKNCDGPFD